MFIGSLKIENSTVPGRGSFDKGFQVGSCYGYQFQLLCELVRRQRSLPELPVTHSFKKTCLEILFGVLQGGVLIWHFYARVKCTSRTFCTADH